MTNPFKNQESIHLASLHHNRWRQNHQSLLEETALPWYSCPQSLLFNLQLSIANCQFAMHEIQKLTIDNCKLTIANFSLTPRRWMMKDTGRLLWLTAGLVLGGLGTFLATGTTRVAQAATHDRFDDFIMCTGPASLFPGVSIDGLWLLDYKAGKLLG